MNRETIGEVIAVSKQWWLKINTKPVRLSMNDGAIYPYIATISFSAAGKDYTKRKWIRAGSPLPAVGSTVKVIYDESKPSKAQVLL